MMRDCLWALALLRRAGLLAGCLLLGTPAQAATLLGYTARLRGIPLLDVTYCLALDSHAYDARLTARTVGLADLLVHGRVDGRATGSVSGVTLGPAQYVEQGRIAGEEHRLTIGYAGGSAVLREMQPPNEKYRLPIPADGLAGALDGLSAITLETLVVSRTGACQGSVLVYDGRQLRRLTTHTGGHDVLGKSARSVFAGPALRCDTESAMLAGYFKDKPIPPQARPRFSKAWLGPLSPGGASLPVRFAFDADVIGDIVVDLDRKSEVATCEGK